LIETASWKAGQPLCPREKSRQINPYQCCSNDNSLIMAEFVKLSLRYYSISICY
jgi:hypothetical protein